MEEIPASGPGNTSEVVGFDIRRHLGIIRTRFWVIFACVVVVFTLTAIRTFRAIPIYEASAMLLIERTLPQVAPFGGLRERTDEGYFSTQVKLVTSRAVLEEALKDERLAKLFQDKGRLTVKRTGLFARVLGEVRAIFVGKPSRSPEPWERLHSLVEVQRVRDTNLVDIEVQGPNAEQAAQTANAVGEAYVNYSVAMRQESAFAAFEMYQQQRKEQEEALKIAEDTLLAYREETTIPLLGPPNENSAMMDHLKSLNDQYTGVRLRRMELAVASEAIRRVEEGGSDLSSLLALVPIRSDRPLMDQLKSLNDEYTKMQLRRIRLSTVAEAIREAQKEGDDIGALLAVEAIRADSSVRDLQHRLTEVQVDTEAALRAHGEKHPEVIALEGQRKYLLSQLREAVSRLSQAIQNEYQMLVRQEERQRDYLLARLREATSAVAEAIQAEHQMLVEREERIMQALAEQNQQALKHARESHVYERLKRDVDRQARVFDVIVDRMKEIDLTKDVGVTNVSLVERASVPITPAKPNKKRFLLLGALMGLFLGFGMAYGVEHLDDTVKTLEDVEKRLGVPWLGYVPEIAAEGAGGDGLAERSMHTLMAPSSPTTESFRSIRTNIYFSGPRGEMKSLLVTSAVPGEGKTVFAANLAVTVAQDGKRVLLVDMDLRRPRIHTVFGLERELGVTNMLVDGMPLEKLVQTPPEGGNGILENLHILCAGTKVPNPAEILGGEALGRFVREAREKYDMVIYDSCPAMFVADAAPLSSGSDGVIMVLRAAKTRRGAADRARKQLEAVDGKVIGAVLNRLRPGSLRGYGYHGYGYGYYHYDYHRYYKDYADEEGQEA